MKKRTSYYLLAGGAVLLVAVGVIIARRQAVSPSSEPIVQTIKPALAVAPPVPLIAPLTASSGAVENYQMNPPEAGWVDPPKPVVPAVAKRPVAAAAPKAPTETTWLKPAPVDSKNVLLGPLRSPSILVEKGALRLTVFDGDAGVKSYRIAAGAVRGDKNIEGDRKTPEGDFYICIRKTTEQTPYTRSLGLSYPNLEDAQRGRSQRLITSVEYHSIAEAIKNNRKPSWKTKLGGAIMIHGKREGRTGTLGCVALDDADIIELYKRLPLNTPVRIVP